MSRAATIAVLLLAPAWIIILGCAAERPPWTPVPPGQTYTSPGGVEVYVPDADAASLAGILERVDSMPVEWFPGSDGTEQGLPPGWSWVLMGEGPILVEGVLATGWCDYATRRCFASTRIDGWPDLIPAGPHEAAHAWYGGSDLHERQAEHG